MDVSKFLPKIIGLYFIIVSSALLFNMKAFVTYVNNLINEPSVLFLAGFFTVILGLIMVVSHNIWQWHWRLIITFLSWLTLLKGISLILFPQAIDESALLFVHNAYFAYIVMTIDFILGVLLTYLGFKRN